MDGYYDHAPLVSMELPLVITSPLREFTRAVSYRTASLLGLPFHDVDRLIEHRVGKKIEQVVIEEGESAYREAEAECLAEVLGQRPSGLIALADQDRPLPEHNGVGPAPFALIILDLELANLYWRIQTTGRERESTQWHPLFEGMPQSVNDLRPFWSTWQGAHSVSGLRIPADSLTVGQTSERLQDWIRESAPAL